MLVDPFALGAKSFETGTRSEIGVNTQIWLAYW
jgi:hypothetical protein